MDVNQDFVNISNMGYAGACLVYVVALLFAVYYYTVTNKAEASGAGRVASAEDSSKAFRAGNVTQILVWLGISLHLVSVVFRGLSVGRFPWGNLFEYVAVLTLIAMIVAALWLRKPEYWSLWLWVLIPIIILMYYGSVKLYIAPDEVVPALKSYWLAIHVTLVSVGAGIGLISGVASILYLIRHHVPRGQEDSHGAIGWLARPLPSLNKLDTIAYKTAVWAIIVFGLGIIMGAIWARGAWGRYWGWDPKETMSFVTWILYAAYLHARATPGWRGVKASWINIFAFATMIFNLFFINMVIPGLHSYSGLG